MRPPDGHQLQIVDDDHVEAVLGLQPAALGANLERRDDGAIVDKDLRLGQHAGRLDQLGPFVVPDLADAQVLRIDDRHAGDQALHQLLGRHFQAKERNPLFLENGRVLHHGERKGRLAGSGAPGHNDAGPRVETRPAACPDR